MRNLIFIILIFSSFSVLANWCPKELENVPALQNGRVKPLLVHVNETYRFLTDEKKPKGMSPLEYFCKLHFNSVNLLKFEDMPTTNVMHIKTKKLLNLPIDEKKITFEKIEENEMLLKRTYNQLKLNDTYKKEIGKLLSKLGLFRSLTSGSNWKLPGKINEWVSLGEFIEQYGVKNSSDWLESIRYASKEYENKNGDKHLTELFFVKANFFTWAIFTAILGMAFFIGLKKYRLGVIFTSLTLILQIIGIIYRVSISGRAPITNMYETVLFSGVGALILSFIMFATRKDRTYPLIGLGYNIMTLLMLKFAHGMLNSSISPLVPVLRDNFWLSTHVTTVILSYSAFALSWILANAILFQQIRGSITNKELSYRSDLIYTTLKYGTILLSAGVILGGVWADYSWGRFWGWDPKETWSLIVLFIYMAILHGRYTKWVPDIHFIPIVAFAFLSVMMAWFGVNYILAAGLHSYGFSEGGAIFLGSFFFIQIGFIIIHALIMRAKKNKAS